MTPVVHSMSPQGRTGGRAYLRMIHEVTAGLIEWRTVPDYKRGLHRTQRT